MHLTLLGDPTNEVRTLIFQLLLTLQTLRGKVSQKPMLGQPLSGGSVFLLQG